MLTAVEGALAQIQTLSTYHAAQGTVKLDTNKVGEAATGVDAANRAVQSSLHAETLVRASLAEADGALRNIAIAAYVGVGYGPPQPAGGAIPAPATPPSTGGAQNQSTLGALTGDDALYAEELLTLVGQQATHNVALAKRRVAEAESGTKRARSGLTSAQGKLADAQAALAAMQHNVELLAAKASAPPPAVPANIATTSKKPSGPAPPSPTILGPAVLSAAELEGWFASTGHKANITVPMSQLAQDYADQGKATGVRDDIAFAQSIIETGYFSFPSYGQVRPTDNNFAGIGACDSCHQGWGFPDAKTGVGAQLELLEAYASPKPVPTPLIGPVGVGGCCTTWLSLAGTWASAGAYGVDILSVYARMLSWAITQRVATAGLGGRG
jgi:hypothetical protein